MAEIKRAISKMKKKKAPEEDEISIEHIRALPEEMMNAWCTALNGLWKEEKLGTNWHIARIFPIHKGGEEREVRNYTGYKTWRVSWRKGLLHG